MRSNVLCNLHKFVLLSSLLKRPFFLLVVIPFPALVPPLPCMKTRCWKTVDKAPFTLGSTCGILATPAASPGVAQRGRACEPLAPGGAAGAAGKPRVWSLMSMEELLIVFQRRLPCSGSIPPPASPRGGAAGGICAGMAGHSRRAKRSGCASHPGLLPIEGRAPMPAHSRGATSMGAHFFFELHKLSVLKLCKTSKKVTK